MLVLSCRYIETNIEKIDDNGYTSSIDKSNSDKSVDTTEVSAILNINSALCVDCDADIFPKIYFSAVYPSFYEEWMISEREHSEVESYFIKQNWLTEDLINELNSFIPDSNNESGPNREFESMCKHMFPRGRKFANYRQLDQYITVFLTNWKCIKRREGNSFRCFYA